MAKKRDYNKVAPLNKSELNKESMLEYCRTKGDKELLWFVDLCKSNRKYKTNNLTGEKIEGYDDTVIKNKFAERYFPNILDKKSKRKKALSFTDMLNEAEAKINK